LTSSAEANELKQVAVYSEAALLGKTSLQSAKTMAGEVNNYTAVGTNQMVMVLWVTDGIASTVASGMHLADKS